MSRFLKVLLRVALVLIGLLLVAVLAVRFLVPAEKFGRMAADRISRETGATVDFADIGISLWPRLRLVVDDCVVHGTGEQIAERTGRDTPLVEFTVLAGKVEADLALAPLLSKRIEAGQIRLVRPRITIKTETPDSPAAGKPSLVPAAAGSTPAMAFLVAGISMIDAEVQWSDQATGRSASVNGWSQEVSMSEIGALTARLRAVASGGPSPVRSTEPSTVELQASIASLRLAGFSQSGPVNLSDLDLDLKLTVPWQADRILFEVDRATWGAVRLDAKGEAVPAPGGGMRLTGDWRLADVDLAVLARDLPGVVTMPEGEAAQWLGAEPVSDGELQAAGRFDLLLPQPEGAGMPEILPGLSGTGRVAGLRFAPPRKLPEVSADADISLADGVLRISGLEAGADGGVLLGEASLDYVKDSRGVFTFVADCRDMPVASLLRPYAAGAARIVEGTAGGKLVGGGILGEKAEVLNSLRIDGDMLLTDGVLHGNDLLAGVSKYLGVRQDLKEIRYRKLLHHLHVADGRYHLSDLDLKGHDTDWQGGGSIGFAGDIDMDLAVKLPADFTPDLGDMTQFVDVLRGDDGRIRLDLHLSGEAARPKVKLKVDMASDSVKEQVNKSIRGFLDKLKGK